MRSVIVRLFEPAPGAGQVGLCGIVEDVRTGTSWPFRGDRQLLDALARTTAGPADAVAEDALAERAGPAGPDRGRQLPG